MYFSATQTDLDIIILSKSERQIPYDITHMQNLNHNTNEHIYETKNRFTDIENRRVLTKRKVDRGGKDWKFGISRCKLLYVV